MIAEHIFRQLCMLLKQNAGDDAVFFVLVVEPATGQKQWYASADGPWPRELAACAGEYEAARAGAISAYDKS